MTDPNSSLLAQFDPICNLDVPETTPVRLAASKGGSTLTMSTFFNRINTQLPAPSIAAPNNRGSLIDISFNLDDVKSSALHQRTPTNHHRQQSSSVAHPHSGTENMVPIVARLSPRKQRDVYVLPPPPQNPQPLDSLSKSAHGRRSSLDLSTLTLDIKQRLAAENMSFDILRDEVSFLTNMAEEEPSATTPLANRSEPKSMAAGTARRNPLSLEVAPPGPDGSRRPKVDLALPTPLSLPLFDFEKEHSPPFDAIAHLPSSSTPIQSEHSRRPRKSVFDAVENTPTASAYAEIPNIVTSWDHPPKMPPLNVIRPSRHLRTASSAAVGHPAPDPTFKLPLPVVRPSSRSPPQTAPPPRSPEKPKSILTTDAEVLKRASSLRTVASSIINKDRTNITKVTRTTSKVEGMKNMPSSSTSTLLRRSKTTISNDQVRLNTEPTTAPETALKKARPSSLMLRRNPLSNNSRSSQVPHSSGLSHDSSGTTWIRGRTLERTASVQTIASHQPTRTEGETPITDQHTGDASTQSSDQVRESRRGNFVSDNAPTRSKCISGVDKDEERGHQPHGSTNGFAAAPSTGPDARTSPDHVESASGLARKQSRKDQFTTFSDLSRTKPSTMQLTSNTAEDTRRRTGTPDSSNQDSSAAAPRSTKAHSRAMERPRLDGLREWAVGVEAATARASPALQSDPLATGAQSKSASGLMRKRSLKEPSSTATVTSLRRTKTTAQLSSDLTTDGTKHPPSGSTSSGVLRSRASIYSLARGSKMAASVEVLPLAAPVKSESKTPAASLRSRPTSIYSSKTASASTPAVNELPRQPVRATGPGTTTSTSTRSTLLRRPSITSNVTPAIMPPRPRTTTGLSAATSLSRVSTSLLRSKSRGQISAR